MNTRLDEMYRSFDSFDKENPVIWASFKKFAFDRINMGYKNYSVNGIFERIRWDTGHPYERDFKMPNNHRPFYARKFMSLYPIYDGFFRTRTQKSALRPPKEASCS